MSSRREFSPVVKRAAYQRSGGICECHLLRRDRETCGAELGEGNTFYEHILPDQLNGEPTLENCAVLSKTCWKNKTAQYDLPTIAKSNRVRDLARNIKQSRKGRPLVGTKASGIKMRLAGGPPLDRSTGRPWGSRR